MEDDAVKPNAIKGRWVGSKTYGRSIPVEKDSIASSKPLLDVSTSNEPPSKDYLLTDSDDGNEVPSSGKTFRFAWKDDLEKLDKQFDEEGLSDGNERPAGLSIPRTTVSATILSSTRDHAQPKKSSRIYRRTSPKPSSREKSQLRLPTSLSPPPQSLFQTRKRAGAHTPSSSPSLTSPLNVDDHVPEPKVNNSASRSPSASDKDTVEPKAGRLNKSRTSRIPSPDGSDRDDGEGPSRASSVGGSKVRGRKSRNVSVEPRQKKSKIKKPTKKEIQETKKESVRLHAAQHVHLERNEERLEIKQLFQKIADRKIPLPPAKTAKDEPPASSDPIQPFTSSPPPDIEPTPGLSKSTSTNATKSTHGSPRTPSSPGPFSNRTDALVRIQEPNSRTEESFSTKLLSKSASESDLDDELPDPLALLQRKEAERNEKEEKQARAEKLKEFKLRALKQKEEARGNETDSADDDLEVVDPKAVNDKSEAGKKGKIQRARVLGFKGYPLFQPQEESQLEVSAGHHGFSGDSFVPPNRGVKDSMSSPLRPSGPKKRGRTSISMKHLNEKLLRKADEKKRQMIKQKEEEWLRRGGKLKDSEEPAGVDIQVWVEKGLENADRRRTEEDESDEDDDDEDYRGSASPRSVSSASDTSDVEVHQDTSEGESHYDRSPQRRPDGRVALAEIFTSDNEDKENAQLSQERSEDDMSYLSPLHLRATRRSGPRVVLDSDEEDSGEGPDAFSHSREGKKAERIVLGELELGDVAGDDTTPEPESLGLEFDSSFAGAEGFTQLFAEEEKEPGGGFAALRPPTLPAPIQSSLLLPAIVIPEAKRKENEAIFREHAEVVLARPRPSQIPSPQKYLTDEGFLTQTRPASYYSSTFFNRPLDDAPSQAPFTEDLDDFQPDFGPTATQEDEELHRRIRRGARPEPTAQEASDEDVRPKNVFDILMNAEHRRKDKVERKLKHKGLDASEFIVGEAEESDEDGDFGFVTKKRKGEDDEEEEEEGEDRIVEGLVDDAEMDEKTIAAEAVLAKVNEQEVEEDAKLLKLHQDVVDGKYRGGKRRDRGFGLDDGDDSDEDEENSMRRKAMYSKRRKIEGDGLDALAENPETMAFYNKYQEDLIDGDDGEFNHLREQEELLAEGEEDEDDEDAEMDQDEVERDEEEPRSRGKISTHQIREELLMRADQRARESSLLPNVHWTEIRHLSSDDDDHVEVDVVVPVPRVPQRFSRLQDELAAEDSWRQHREEGSSKDLARLQQWAKEESQNRNYSTGRGAAVTGHASASSKSKPGNASLNSGSSSSRSVRRAQKEGSRLFEKMNSKKLSGFEG